MTEPTFPSPNPAHRRADLIVHMIALASILIAGGIVLGKSALGMGAAMALAVLIYVVGALFSNVASNLYHFSRLHDRRPLLRRIDHAAIYVLITGSFTPFLVQAATPWTLGVLIATWALTAVAVWNKVTNPTIKSRWSTASYLGLGAIGLTALPDLRGVPQAVVWWILLGAAFYVIGTAIYARKSMPYRYAVWHGFAFMGGAAMYVAVWTALFQQPA